MANTLYCFGEFLGNAYKAALALTLAGSTGPRPRGFLFGRSAQPGVPQPQPDG